MKTKKIDMIRNVAAAAEITAKKAKIAFDTTISELQKTIRKDGKIVIPGMGTFTVRKRAERKSRNPRTGEQLIIKEHKSVAFKCSRQLKNDVNKTM